MELLDCKVKVKNTSASRIKTQKQRMLKGNLYFSDYITEAMKEPREREKEQEQIPRSYTNAPPLPSLPMHSLK